eukprot:TRINITY_DN39595_c0_g1_i2.p1 TRINITY_DN39595_c0_g1~~TRINITY_DN39595_c0_g1_i2.p1  ORF type:complete len:360 (+),score=107.73 TRINITY_DN39595_c0_g1_i2:268-1347(+)
MSFIVKMADCEDTAQDQEWLEQNWAVHMSVACEYPALLAVKLAVESLWAACWEERADLEGKILKLLEACEELKANQNLPPEWNHMLAALESATEELQHTKRELAHCQQQLADCQDQLASGAPDHGQLAACKDQLAECRARLAASEAEHRVRGGMQEPVLPMGGDLYKKGNNTNTWRPRHLRLTATHIELFDATPTRSQQPPKRRFKMSEVHRVLKSARQPYAFKLSFNAGSELASCTFDALNHESLQRWVFCISWCVAQVRGEVGPSSPRSAVRQASLEPASPLSAPRLQLPAVLAALEHCGEGDASEVQACMEAMAEWLELTQLEGHNRRPRESSEHRRQQLEQELSLIHISEPTRPY